MAKIITKNPIFQTYRLAPVEQRQAVAWRAVAEERPLSNSHRPDREHKKIETSSPELVQEVRHSSHAHASLAHPDPKGHQTERKNWPEDCWRHEKVRLRIQVDQKCPPIDHPVRRTERKRRLNSNMSRRLLRPCDFRERKDPIHRPRLQMNCHCFRCRHGCDCRWLALGRCSLVHMRRYDCPDCPF